MVSILNCETAFYFPDPQPLTTRLVDVLEKDVPEEFYLSEKSVRMFRIHAAKQEAKGNGFARQFAPTDGGALQRQFLQADIFDQMTTI